MKKVDRVRMRFVPAWFKPVIRRVAKLAGVSPGVVLGCVVEQRALDGRTRFTVPGRDGSVATYEPEGRRGR